MALNKLYCGIIAILVYLFCIISTVSRPEYLSHVTATELYPKYLYGGDRIYSPDASAKLVMQTDGNLGLSTYNGSLWNAEWSTNTESNAYAHAVLHSNGNLIIYSFNFNILWSSDTAEPTPTPPYRLLTSSGGYAYILNGNNIQIWKSHTAPDNFEIISSYIAPSSYLYIPVKLAWQDAENFCQTEYNSHLASIHSVEDFNEIVSNLDRLDSSKRANIGLRRSINDNNLFVWSDNSNWDFGQTFFELPWDLGQPTGNGYCVRGVNWDNRPDGVWNDVDCSESRFFLCNSPYKYERQLVIIWEDDFESYFNSEWNGHNDYFISSEHTECPNKDAKSRCAGTFANNGDSYIEKWTNIARYSFVQLQIDVAGDGLEENTGDLCEIQYQFDNNGWITATQYRGSDLSYYPNQVINFPSAISYSTIWIRLNIHGNSNDGGDQCYWDNVILRGEQTLHPTAYPTIVPSQNPSGTPTLNPSATPSSNPSSSPSNHPSNTPTNNPTQSPTRSPIDVPTNIPSQTPSQIQIDPTQHPTNTPSSIPTWKPTNIETNTPSNIPTWTPTLHRTMSPTLKYVNTHDAAQTNDANKFELKSIYIITVILVIIICVSTLVLILIFRRAHKKPVSGVPKESKSVKQNSYNNDKPMMELTHNRISSNVRVTVIDEFKHNETNCKTFQPERKNSNIVVSVTDGNIANDEFIVDGYDETKGWGSQIVSESDDEQVYLDDLMLFENGELVTTKQ